MKNQNFHIQQQQSLYCRHANFQVRNISSVKHSNYESFWIKITSFYTQLATCHFIQHLSVVVQQGNDGSILFNNIVN